MTHLQKLLCSQFWPLLTILLFVLCGISVWVIPVSVIKKRGWVLDWFKITVHWWFLASLCRHFVATLYILVHHAAIKNVVGGGLFSCQVASDSLRPPGLQHIKLPCPSPSPGVCPESCPLTRWRHPTISSSVTLFSCLQSFPALGSFQMSWLFTSGGQSVGVSASVLPMNIQGWFPLGWLVWSPCSPRDSQESSPIPQFKRINSLALSLLYGCGPALTWLLGKP